MMKRHPAGKGGPQLGFQGSLLQGLEGGERILSWGESQRLGQGQGTLHRVALAFEKDQHLLTFLDQVLDVGKEDLARVLRLHRDQSLFALFAGVVRLVAEPVSQQDPLVEFHRAFILQEQVRLQPFGYFLSFA